MPRQPSAQVTNFDFDRWADLARRDPERFEQEREAAVAALIAHAPHTERQRLIGLQWRIDQDRRRAPNALTACINLYQRMWDAVLREDGLLASIERLQSAQSHPRPGKSDARILPLVRPCPTPIRGGE